MHLLNQGNSSSQRFDVRIKDVEDEFRSRPAEITKEFDAQNLWSAAGNLDEIVSISNSKPVKALSELKVKKMIDISRSGIMADIKKDIEPLTMKCHKVKPTLLTVSQSLKAQIDINAQGIIDAANQGSPRGDNVDFSRDITRLDNILVVLEFKTASLVSGQGEGIEFNNMRFRGKKDSDAWIETHAPGGNFGFVVDFHTMMEHINHNITGVDALNQLQIVYK